MSFWGSAYSENINIEKPLIKSAKGFTVNKILAGKKLCGKMRKSNQY
jgi:hypothetical protein